MNNNFRYLLAGLLIFLIILLQPIYLEWLGYDSGPAPVKVVPDGDEMLIQQQPAFNKKLEAPVLKDEISESYITIVTPLYTATISNRSTCESGFEVRH